MVRYLIWSHRHREWWGPDRAGYTRDASRAGVYSREEAADITIGGCLPGANIAVDLESAKLLNGKSPQEVEEELETWRRI